MENISVFDMLKIGIGPSSSHTLGPWRAATQFCKELKELQHFDSTDQVIIQLYGSLALTGKGHGTDLAIFMGLSGTDPEIVPLDQVNSIPKAIQEDHLLYLGGSKYIGFNPLTDLQFHEDEFLPFHSNGMRLTAYSASGTLIYEETFYSIGGGFFVKATDEKIETSGPQIPFPINSAQDLLGYCASEDLNICQIVALNEQAWRSTEETREGLLHIWQVMLDSIYKGVHTSGELPGGLHVQRRAAGIYNQVQKKSRTYTHTLDWIAFLRDQQADFKEQIRWISAFAMAVNEENANFGRIVTAPTNGSAGVIPAVLLYYLVFCDQDAGEQAIINFLMTASEVGSIFKKGATISAAMGGCQAEIGVSSAMAAAALTEALGGTPEQSLMAAEIAMEHHLGLTCDPIAGLVQVPCIERNSMGAMKAITAAQLALDADPKFAKVSLDKVVNTMLETAKDMHIKYKETSKGGLAMQVSHSISEC